MVKLPKFTTRKRQLPSIVLWSDVTPKFHTSNLTENCLLSNVFGLSGTQAQTEHIHKNHSRLRSYARMWSVKNWKFKMFSEKERLKQEVVANVCSRILREIQNEISSSSFKLASVSEVCRGKLPRLRAFQATAGY